VLVVIGGLLVRTLQNLKTQDLGFRPANVVSVQLGTQRGYRPDWPQLIPQLLPRVAALPGVQTAAVSYNGLLGNATSGVTGLRFDGDPPSATGQRAASNWVSPRYFAVAGIPILAGREFSDADDGRARKVAIINQALARRSFANRNPLGQRFEFNREPFEVIGIAKDVKAVDLRAPAAPSVYFAALQLGSVIHSLEVRTMAPAAGLAPALRRVVREVDGRLRVGEIAVLDQRIEQKLAREFLVADIAGFFGGLTLLLVSIGIYGTLAYAVAQRTKELALRMALGARGAALLSMLLRDLLTVLAVGLGIGAIAALAAGRLVRSILYGLTPADPATLTISVLLVCTAAAAATYLPARRALGIDPVRALRFD
jgi:predicted permease